MPGTRFNLTITSSGGEVPGEATVWPPIEDWASFGTIEGPLRNGDRVRVDNLEPGAGHAEYNGADWELQSATFPTVADMLDFGGLIQSGGIALVGTGVETDPAYYYDGDAWVRTPDNTKYIWPDKANWGALDLITEPQDGDEVLVEFLGISTSYGIAKWSETAVDWELQEVTYSGWDPYGFSDVFVIIGTIASGAIIRTDGGSRGAPIYFWDSTGSEWVRSPEDVAYTWAPVTLTNWAGLGALEGILAGDRAEVDTWTTGGTAGVARYDGTDWRLVEGVVNTIANLLVFSGEKETGAKVTVGTGVAADPVYFWSGTAWLRTADQSHYIWPQVNNWAALLAPTLARPHAINNDEVHVHNLGPAHSNGTAQMQGGTWKLIEGKWASVSDMNLWPTTDIHSGAVAFIDPTHQYDQDSTVYYYTGGAWVATQAAGVTKVHTISSIYDFSASGLTDGDYGVLTPSGGSPIVLRYKAACTIAAGGTRAVWMTPTAYAGSPVLYAWTNGTENNSTLTSQGWTISLGTGCTIVPTGGYQRMNAPGVNPLSASLTAMAGAIAAATKIESIYECRATLPNGTACRAKQLYLADGTGYSIGDSGQGGATGYGYRQSGTTTIANTPIRDVTNVRIPALAATPFVCVARDEGRTVLTSLSVNGNAFADYRRSLGSIAANLIYVYVTCDVGAAVTMDYRGQILTY